MKVPEEFIGKAQCGCVHHAEEGIACPHDEQLYLDTVQPETGLTQRQMDHDIEVSLDWLDQHEAERKVWQDL